MLIVEYLQNIAAVPQGSSTVRAECGCAPRRDVLYKRPNPAVCSAGCSLRENAREVQRLAG